MDEQIYFFKHNNKNKNTERTTNTWIHRYKIWAAENNFPVNLETLDVVNLNTILETYFASVKKYDGKDYEPSSLGNMEAAIDRYLLEKGLTISILKDKEFKGARDVIEGRARYFREELGLGRKPNRARSLNVRDEGELWSAGQLGDQNSRSLIYNMWYMLTQHLGLRGRQEHYSMKIEDFVLNKDDQGNE